MRSRLLKDIFPGRFNFSPRQTYRIIPEGVERRLEYLLTDSIYPYWPSLLKPIKHNDLENEEKSSRRQEATRRYIEHLFGVLKNRFQMWRLEMMIWELEEVINVAQACIILQNLIVQMHQNGELRDEAVGDNMITEFYDVDQEAAAEDATK